SRRRPTGQRHAETSLGGNRALCYFSENLRGGMRNLLGGFENANVSSAVCGCHINLTASLEGRAGGAKEGRLVLENDVHRNLGQHRRQPTLVDKRFHKSTVFKFLGNLRSNPATNIESS